MSVPILQPAKATIAKAGFGVAALFALAIGLLAIAPFAIYPVFVMQGLCVALFACAFNLLLGYAGLLSFGHAMFFGSAAYVCAHAVKEWGIEPLTAILMGVAAAAVIGLATGALAVRRQGIYFAMITVAFSQMIYFYCLQARFTHGEDGITNIAPGNLFGFISLSNLTNMYYFVLAVTVFGFLLIYRIINSPFGDVLKAIRDNEARAILLGYRVDQYKLAAFVLSAALAGLAGATKALVTQNASLTDVSFSTSGEVVLMTLLGGMGTLSGPVIGAFLIVSMKFYLSGYGQWVTAIQGFIFVTCVLLFRRGIVGEIARVTKWPL